MAMTQDDNPANAAPAGPARAQGGEQQALDSRKFVHGTGYFVAVAVGAALVAAALYKGAQAPVGPPQPSQGQGQE